MPPASCCPITSPGGNKAAGVVDWSALAGRRVVIWPDADEPGQTYARGVTAELAKLSLPPTVAIVVPPDGVAEVWDAADAVGEGWAAARAAELVASAAPKAPQRSQRRRNGCSI